MDIGALDPVTVIALAAIGLVAMRIFLHLFGGQFGIEADWSSDGGDGGGD